MAENSFYKDWEILTAAEIWVQLSDYAKERIDFVLRFDKDYLSWLNELSVPNRNSFHSEFEIEEGHTVVLNCLKNNRPCYIEYQGEDGVCIYTKCKMVRESYFADFQNTNSVEFDTDQGRVKLDSDKIIRVAYNLEGLA
jgi:hypothetical protein